MYLQRKPHVPHLFQGRRLPVEHRARRELLPPEWLNAVPNPTDHLGDLFTEVLERARERVRSQREVHVPQPSDDRGDELGSVP